ncbi:MAG: CC_3452 family protein [Caulobacteraceae bacterium]
MKLALATACAVFSLSLAGAALADSRVIATLAAPGPAHAKFIAADAVWNCDAATCVAALAPDGAAGLSGCKDLAKKVGPLAAYASERRSLDSAALAKCNTAAAAPANIGTASR